MNIEPVRNFDSFFNNIKRDKILNDFTSAIAAHDRMGVKIDLVVIVKTKYDKVIKIFGSEKILIEMIKEKTGATVKFRVL